MVLSHALPLAILVAICGPFLSAGMAGAKDRAPVCPAALFTFEERGSGVKDFGGKVSDLLFAKLAAEPSLYLVDRVEIAKTLAEQSMNVAGVVDPDSAVKIGHLTGAQLLVTNARRGPGRTAITGEIRSLALTRATSRRCR